MSNKISDIRSDYLMSDLNKSDLESSPISQFKSWFSKALESNIFEPNAMVLSTADISGKVNARVVLLKDITPEGFVFFTNYNSSKGRDLRENPQGSLTFFWPQLEQQIRVNGIIEMTTRVYSKAYFDSRPRESQISAIASNQSEKLKSREELSNEFIRLEKEFMGSPISIPNHWGGYLVKPIEIEFWQGRKSRMHDRFAYSLINNEWIIERLSP
jgi:pyridoxamine 5'-phosphate oxidase